MSHATNSHATDSHAKHMYITQIYTQARHEYDNRDEYLARIACSMIIKIIYTKRINHAKMNEIRNKNNVHVKVSRIIMAIA